MELMTGYYRQKEEALALLLQQYISRGVPVCLGCICGGESREAGCMGGQFTGRLLKEFRELSLCKAVRKPEKTLKRMGERLLNCREAYSAPRDFWLAGILCIGSRFLLFHKGAVRFKLCNTGFGRPALCEIGAADRAEQMRLQWGCIEPGIGILLASDSFCENIPPESLLNCLAVKDIHDPRQTQKRIQELGSAAEQKGGIHMAALLVEVR